jgi:hypothetical protein
MFYIITMDDSILSMRDLGGDMVAPEFLWRGPIYGCANLPIDNMVAYFWNIMVVVCIMYGCDPIMVAPFKNTVAPHICSVVKYGCVTYYHVNAGIR